MFRVPRICHRWRETAIMLFFVDSFLRYSWLYLLKLKSEVSNVFLQFKKHAELQFNSKLKCLQADMGTEYKPLIPYLTKLGVHFRTSCAYTHQQNNVPERKHRHLVETGLTLLAQAKMLLIFWVEAYQTAVLLINNLPT